jgi:hypothetical protein
MGANKNAFQRYIIIIKELGTAGRDTPKLTGDLIDAIRDETGYDVSVSTIQKDISTLRHDSVFGIHAPIMSVVSYRGGGYYLQPNWKLSETLNKVWGV